ncbi:efflux RND transporter periplasmic adaptor subunit [Pseudoalteromonas luteoviolacea]|uniref:efflux RND transporter periplasmic adaptor subunit n=1 Tax=Pseudoalteromonas luteoviolacea TaxID=43657 RepID=UPI001B3A4D80|nr:efflux RND transporter periplasmic adaptor subunit [Pseudoalteromonas luteoviolacea]MBQ4878686.1 efflux RND transporter periplasmic adaptor subunit [Pseudoalteromonas luteoviolacea]MBQ4907226.1 efflux RND transporter periplasmic adaptor subunit [Pseudoalteromonas luteoviolacea]
MGINKNKSYYHTHAGRLLVLLAVLILGGSACAALLIFGKKEVAVSPRIDTRPTVVTQPLTIVDYRTKLSLSGVLQPSEKTDIAFELSGKIVWLNNKFIEGGIVKKGEVLASLDPFDYETEVKDKQANLALAQATLSEELAKAAVAKKEWAHNPNSTELALRKPQVASAKARLKAAQASLEKANKNLLRTKYYAPYDALVTNRNTGLGQVVSKAQALGQLVNLSYGEMHVPIAGFDRPFLPTLPITDVQISTGSIERNGVLTRHTGRFNEKTRMAYYVIRIDDPYALHSDNTPLYFGQFLQANVNGITLKNVLKIPQAQLKNKAVWLLDESQTLTKYSAPVLRQEQDFALIAAPKQQHYQLVTRLPEYPQHGMQVKQHTANVQLADKGDNQ